MNMKGQSSSKKRDDSNNSCELEAEHRNRANLIQRLVSNLTEGRTSSAACKKIVFSKMFEHYFHQT
jgi:hypothetical protein